MTHEMDLKAVSEKGTELWRCPVCGRTLLIEWQPWKLIVLVDGDEAAGHSGGKGGIKIGNVEVEQARRRDEQNHISTS